MPDPNSDQFAVGATAQPNVAFPVTGNPTDVQQPNLGNVTPPVPQQAPPVGQAPQLPPRPIGTSVASQPVSKAEFFRDMLGKFFYAVGTGLANRGSGPEADIRGAGAAMAALPNLNIEQQQLQIARENAQGLQAYHAAQAGALQNRFGLTQVPLIGKDGNPVQGSDGQPVMMTLPADQAAKYMQTMGAAGIRTTGAANVANINAANRLDVEKMKVMVQAGQVSKVLPATDQNGNPAMEAFNKFGKSIGFLEGALPPTSYLPKSTSTIEYKQLDDGSIVALPKGSTSQPVLTGGKTKPGVGVGVPVTVKDAQGNPITGKGAVTSTTRTMVETAPKVIDLVGRIKGQIDDLEKSGDLGPGMSRWNEFWSGKVGVTNPKFRAMMTNTTLLSTLLMRMHMGARGSTQIMEHFDNMIGAGHQSAANMKAALDQLELYANDVKGAAPLPTNYGKSNQGPAKTNYSSDNPFAKKP